MQKTNYEKSNLCRGFKSCMRFQVQFLFSLLREYYRDPYEVTLGSSGQETLVIMKYLVDIGDVSIYPIVACFVI